MHNVSKHALWHKEGPLGSTRWPTTFRGSSFPKSSKMVFYRHVLASANRFKTNDVVEYLRRWRRWLVVIGRLAYTIYIIGLLGITAVLYFQTLSTTNWMQRKYQLMQYIQYENSVLAKFVHHLFEICCTGYRIKCWRASKTSKLIRKTRTLGETFDFAQT